MYDSAIRYGCLFLLAWVSHGIIAGQEQKGELSFKSALDNLNDQDQEKAIQEFLKALEALKSASPPPVSTQEKDLFDKGYQIYLSSQAGRSPRETALQLYQELKQVTDTHKEYYLLNLLMSTAYANLNRYEDFFHAFYRSYPYYSDHYLSYKTLAALHIRLFEKARLPEDKEAQRTLVFKYAAIALGKNPGDIGLYKMAALFADEKQRGQAVAHVLNEIIQKDIQIPRHDIPFFVHQAMDTKQTELAQKFVDKSREWYHYSRSISEAQEYIDQHR